MKIIHCNGAAQLTHEYWALAGRVGKEGAQGGRGHLRSWGLAVQNALCLSLRKVPEPEHAAISSKPQPQKEIHTLVCNANIILLGWPPTSLWSPVAFLRPLLRERKGVCRRGAHLSLHLINTHLLAKNYAGCLQILICICTVTYSLPAVFQYKPLNNPRSGFECFPLADRLEIRKLQRLNDFV